jgi:serine/threonine protein phosphatase PrpC
LNKRIEITVAAASDIGTVREHNEDHVLIGDLDQGDQLAMAEPWTATGDRGPLMIVCDGMGGVEGGEVASELAARVIWREMQTTSSTQDPEVFARLLRRATRIANNEVHTMAKKEPGLRGMGTTVSAGAVVGEKLVVATVGDSRAYILRRGELVQVTRDQSLSSALLAAGHNQEIADRAGSAILQALGVGDDVEPSLSLVELRRGDRVLLCSDGLHGLVGDQALAILMAPTHTLAEAVKLLVTAARAAGGSDNITAVVADVGGDRLREPVDDNDLPTFREFDPQKEGDPALTSTSVVARRLAARIGLPTSSIPPSIPVTGQHTAIRGTRTPATALPIEDIDGPARKHLQNTPIAWWWYVVIGAFACALAWIAGGR